VHKAYAYWVRFVALVFWLSRAFAYVAAAALVVSVVVILREAVGRYFFDAPTSYAVPLVAMLVVVILYASLAYTATVDGHVSSDIIYVRLPPRGQTTVNLLGDLAGAGIAALLAREVLGAVDRALAIDAVVADLYGLPLFVQQLFVVVGSLLLMLVCLVKIPNHIANLVSGRQEPLLPHESDKVGV
jgi:TRAP-type C4-dicarboxylate transport system permease small subunit